jgi:hypothetical protein
LIFSAVDGAIEFIDAHPPSKTPTATALIAKRTGLAISPTPQLKPPRLSGLAQSCDCWLSGR